MPETFRVGITRDFLKADGTLLIKDWFKGLNSPKGVFVFQNRVLIAEKDSVTVLTFSQREPGGIPKLEVLPGAECQRCTRRGCRGCASASAG